ncbi:MAG: hypothetical protein NZ874_09650, partial [Fimbriimonadales bacterium]|nr:hypothetical protein [Fimbriimonadales bacterium]
MRKLCRLFTVWAFVMLCLPAFAQQGGPYDLSWWTIDGGGITFASGGRYQVGGTVGQPDAHDLQPAGRYTQSGGFWFPCAIA